MGNLGIKVHVDNGSPSLHPEGSGETLSQGAQTNIGICSFAQRL